MTAGLRATPVETGQTLHLGEGAQQMHVLAVGSGGGVLLPWLMFWERLPFLWEGIPVIVCRITILTLEYGFGILRVGKANIGMVQIRLTLSKISFM